MIRLFSMPWVSGIKHCGRMAVTERFPYFIAFLLLLSGCSSDGAKPLPPLGFTVKSEIRTNNGNLFYFLVRNVNEKQFMVESYQEVAGKAFSDPADPNVLGVYSIVPGVEEEVSSVKPAQNLAALYFMFTQPGAQWKKLLSLPLADRYDVKISGDNQVEISEHSFW